MDKEDAEVPQRTQRLILAPPLRALRPNLILLYLVFALISCSQETGRLDQIDKIFSTAAKEDKFNGNVLIAEKGEIIYKKSYGKSDWASSKPLNDSSIFELASVSKQFTAMAIMILVEKGKLSYDDSLRKYFPELPYHNINIRHLLNHTSGLPDYMSLFNEHWKTNEIATNEDVIRLLAMHRPDTLFSPGRKWLYSNTGYALLASIIEKASGKSFAGFLQEYIFTPLGMHHTSVFRRRYEKRKLDNYAYGYVFDPSKNAYVLPDDFFGTSVIVYTLDGIQGDGTVNSTTLDLLKWDRALYTEKLVSKKTLEDAFRPATLTDGRNTTYGYGWMVSQSTDFGKFVSHGGGWPGYSTYIERHLDNDKTIIILQNNGKELPKLQEVRRLLYGLKTERVKEQEVSLNEMQEYVGVYELAPEFKLTISVQNEKLFGQATGQQAFELFKEKKDWFFLKEVEAKLQFLRENNKVNALILYQNGIEVKGPKIK